MSDPLVETARVIEPFDGGAWVEVLRRPACGGCAARAGCGTRTLARWGAARPLRLAVSSRRPLAIGQEVRLALPARALTGASLWAYGLPLALAFAGALLAEALGGGDPVVALAFAAGLGAGLLGLGAHARRAAGRYRPRLLEPPC